MKIKEEPKKQEAPPVEEVKEEKEEPKKEEAPPVEEVKKEEEKKEEERKKIDMK